MKNFKELLSGVRGFVFDVDGVLTNGSLLLMPNGEMVRTLHVRDGYAIEQAISAGFHVAVITSAKSDSLKAKLASLGISSLYMGVRNKKEAFEEFLYTYDLQAEEILIMGDDLPDYEMMNLCSTRTCPADAAAEIRALCPYISPRKGGEGCVRDVIEQVLKAQLKWLHA
ncbi:MAG TPA: HAD hydrolase family protein [Bacteroidia bacterium]|jgi:3-deoxy-D-manno-octulosonate 8-phosphate phosphatase (KDO 8-P phosphatase)|nr:HAD hydrolase family protein [Bacteroidia bacterium]